MSTHVKKWTPAEDSRLLRQVKAFPQNLNQCFIIVAEELERTPKAVSQHWYKVVSKKPENIAFLTLSGAHKAVNRKNSAGQPSSRGMFHRICRLLHLC